MSNLSHARPTEPHRTSSDAVVRSDNISTINIRTADGATITITGSNIALEVQDSVGSTSGGNRRRFPVNRLRNGGPSSSENAPGSEQTSDLIEADNGRTTVHWVTSNDRLLAQQIDADRARNISRGSSGVPPLSSKSPEPHTFPVGAHSNLTSPPIPNPSTQIERVRVDHTGQSSLSSQTRSALSPNGELKAARPSGVDRERIERQGHVRKTSDPKAIAIANDSAQRRTSPSHVDKDSYDPNLEMAGPMRPKRTSQPPPPRKMSGASADRIPALREEHASSQPSKSHSRGSRPPDGASALPSTSSPAQPIQIPSASAPRSNLSGLRDREREDGGASPMGSLRHHTSRMGEIVPQIVSTPPVRRPSILASGAPFHSLSDPSDYFPNAHANAGDTGGGAGDRSPSPFDEVVVQNSYSQGSSIHQRLANSGMLSPEPTGGSATVPVVITRDRSGSNAQRSSAKAVQKQRDAPREEHVESSHRAPAAQAQGMPPPTYVPNAQGPSQPSRERESSKRPQAQAQPASGLSMQRPSNQERPPRSERVASAEQAEHAPAPTRSAKPRIPAAAAAAPPSSRERPAGTPDATGQHPGVNRLKSTSQPSSLSSTPAQDSIMASHPGSIPDPPPLPTSLLDRSGVHHPPPLPKSMPRQAPTSKPPPARKNEEPPASAGLNLEIPKPDPRGQRGVAPSPSSTEQEGSFPPSASDLSTSKSPSRSQSKSRSASQSKSHSHSRATSTSQSSARIPYPPLPSDKESVPSPRVPYPPLPNNRNVPSNVRAPERSHSAGENAHGQRRDDGERTKVQGFASLQSQPQSHQVPAHPPQPVNFPMNMEAKRSRDVPISDERPSAERTYSQMELQIMRERERERARRNAETEQQSNSNVMVPIAYGPPPQPQPQSRDREAGPSSSRAPVDPARARSPRAVQKAKMQAAPPHASTQTPPSTDSSSSAPAPPPAAVPREQRARRSQPSTPSDRDRVRELSGAGGQTKVEYFKGVAAASPRHGSQTTTVEYRSLTGAFSPKAAQTTSVETNTASRAPQGQAHGRDEGQRPSQGQARQREAQQQHSRKSPGPSSTLAPQPSQRLLDGASSSQQSLTQARSPAPFVVQHHPENPWHGLSPIASENSSQIASENSSLEQQQPGSGLPTPDNSPPPRAPSPPPQASSSNLLGLFGVEPSHGLQRKPSKLEVGRGADRDAGSVGVSTPPDTPRLMAMQSIPEYRF